MPPQDSVTLPFRWVKKTGEFQRGDYLYLNMICVGSYDWNSSRTQGDTDKSTRWIGSIELPSLKDSARRVYGSDEAEVKQRIEGIVTRWFTHATKGAT